MNRFLREIANELNVKKQAADLGVSVWRTPNVLFIFLGLAIIIIMTSTYYVSRNNVSEGLLIGVEIGVVVIILSIGSFIISGIEQIAKVNRMKTEFISVASHQLKTPITEVNWVIEAMFSKYKDQLNPEQTSIINDISHSNEKMSRIINDLLDVARIDQGRIVMAEDRVNLPDLIQEVADDNALLAKASDVEIEIMKEGEIPEIIADRRRIGVVIDNFLSNAVKYMKSGGKVLVGMKKEEGRVVVCVKDNGIGIPKNQREAIFQKFFRGGNIPRLQTEGSGLGLYISKNFINFSGGELWFNSQEGEGSEFCFSLPIKEEIKSN